LLIDVYVLCLTWSYSPIGIGIARTVPKINFTDF
jgi:hypothetical protein